MLKPELVAPAGNYTKLKIALAYGADAVYAGLNNFSLRAATAKEFDYESFKEAVNYTHSLGKKIFVTLNAFYFSSQIENLKKHIKKLYDMKPDAFIIASLGVANLIKEMKLDIALHISTQANVLNYLDAQVYEKLGAKRVVIARELSLKEAKIIKEHCKNLELEAFVHGSMCFAYSGRCLISSVQSGRMSNRGSCANDCRFSYELYAKGENGTLFRLEQDEKGTHIFNSKDLNLCTYVEQIIKENCINAFKIEGRTKSEYYVALATRTYRMAIDDALSGNFNPKHYESEIQTLANRGFTDGYLVNRALDRQDTQNLSSSIEQGSKQVCAFSEDGNFFKCKGKIALNESYEILCPLNSHIYEKENELGKIYKKDSKYFVEFKKLLSKTNKEFKEIHSGNENEITLPVSLPKFSFLRR